MVRPRLSRQERNTRPAGCLAHGSGVGQTDWLLKIDVDGKKDDWPIPTEPVSQHSLSIITPPEGGEESHSVGYRRAAILSTIERFSIRKGV